MRFIITILFSFSASIFQLYSQRPSPYIQVDQFGYLPNTQKVAVLVDPQIGFNAAESYQAPAILELKNADSNGTVFSGAPTLWNDGATHTQSGDRGWWFDFSSVSTSGNYYVYDAINDERSAEFTIGTGVYDELLKAAGRMFFYNRCGIAKLEAYTGSNWSDNASFSQDEQARNLADPNNPAAYRDMSGGWFDAGDYNKYVTFAVEPIHDLLSTYEENSNIFGDNWNIPESGNGIPDILDEVKWELEFLEKMTNADGSVHIKMGSIDYGDNANSPPSLNTDPRYYGPVCTSASIAVASMFAHAALVFQNISSLSGYAENLRNKAEQAWTHVLPFLNNNNLDENCDDGTIKSGDADRNTAEQRGEAITAAIYLYLLTGSVAYENYLIANLNDAPPIGGDLWDNYNTIKIDALLRYAVRPSSDAVTANIIINNATTAAQNNWNNYFGFDDADLYRAFAPDWTYHWGSNKPKANLANLNLIYNKYELLPTNTTSYAQKAAEQIHYFHGVNPMGLVYLSNMYAYGAERSINEIYHGWFADGTDYDHALNSPFGPAPGYISGGPNQNYDEDTSLTPPYNQPPQKSYLDWNTESSQASWEITEPAIYYQAAYIRSLAGIMNTLIALPVTWESFSAKLVEKNQVALKWTTASEQNTSHFDIERTSNLRQWEKVGALSARGNSITQEQYQFLDILPSSGTYYYRLKQWDQDGLFSYSEIRNVEALEEKQLAVYPNPVKTVLSVKGSALNDESLSWEIYDLAGKVLRPTYFKENDELKINLSTILPGIYMLKIKSNQDEWIEKIIRW